MTFEEKGWQLDSRFERVHNGVCLRWQHHQLHDGGLY